MVPINPLLHRDTKFFMGRGWGKQVLVMADTSFIVGHVVGIFSNEKGKENSSLPNSMRCRI